jgi:hypothetical protein
MDQPEKTDVQILCECIEQAVSEGYQDMLAVMIGRSRADKLVAEKKARIASSETN